MRMESYRYERVEVRHTELEIKTGREKRRARRKTKRKTLTKF